MRVTRLVLIEGLPGSGKSTLAIENAAGDWASYQRQVLEYLDLPSATEQARHPLRCTSLVGSIRVRMRTAR